MGIKVPFWWGSGWVRQSVKILNGNSPSLKKIEWCEGCFASFRSVGRLLASLAGYVTCLSIFLWSFLVVSSVFVSIGAVVRVIVKTLSNCRTNERKKANKQLKIKYLNREIILHNAYQKNEDILGIINFLRGSSRNAIQIWIGWLTELRRTFFSDASLLL